MKRIVGVLRTLWRYYYAKRVLFDAWWVRYRRESRLYLIAKRGAFLRFLRSPLRHKPSFLVGPTNSANQGTLWTRTLSRSGAPSQSLRISNEPTSEWFTTDIAISRDEWLNFDRRQALADVVAAKIDVVLFESLRPVFRLLNAKDGREKILEDFELMERIGKRYGVVFHGSDIRDPDAHATRSEFSPFRTSNDQLDKLRERTAENRAILPILREKKIPIFVTTQDLLIDVPDATWLPVTIDFDRFHKVALESPVFPDPLQKLRVLFLPSRSWLKSADLIEPVLIKLRDEGVITYRSYLSEGTALQHAEVPAAMAEADLVIDQFLGVIGVFPLEALAAGRLVMSYLPPEVRDVPIINITPETLESEIRRVAAERPLPNGGVSYAEQWHDGRQSVLALSKEFGFKI